MAETDFATASAHNSCAIDTLGQADLHLATGSRSYYHEFGLVLTLGPCSCLASLEGSLEWSTVNTAANGELHP